MSLSINSNSSALAILQSLTSTSGQLTQTEGQVSSGLQIQTASDNPAVYNLAQTQRADIANLASVTTGLGRAQSIADVAVSAGQTVSDLLTQIQAKVLAANDPTQDANSIAAYNSDFQSLLKQIQTTLQSASFGGINLLNGSVTNGVSFMATADASSYLTIQSQNLSLGGTLITLPAGGNILTPTAAASALSEVQSSITNVNHAVATLGTQSNQVQTHASFVATLSDNLTTGVSGLVDADVAAESARLTALQVQQQLSTQTLSIANQQPSVILTLLRGG